LHSKVRRTCRSAKIVRRSSLALIARCQSAALLPAGFNVYSAHRKTLLNAGIDIDDIRARQRRNRYRRARQRPAAAHRKASRKDAIRRMGGVAILRDLPGKGTGTPVVPHRHR
jgi:hypothetical protein